MKRVLFTGGGGAGTTALWRLLEGKYECYFADADVDAIPAVIPEDRKVEIRPANLSSFAGSMKQACTGFDLLLPGVDEELPHLPIVDAEIMLPYDSFVDLALDKVETLYELHRAGLDAPLVRTGYPRIYKPAKGRGSRGFHVIKSQEQAVAWLGLYGTRPAVQELLAGQEYTVMMAATREGELKAVVPVRVEKKRGVTLRGVTEYVPKVIDYCTQVHEALGGSACYNIQLMHSAERTAAFEINPRVSTTMCLGVAAGVDPIAIFLGEETNTEFRPGVWLTRYWENVFS